MIGSFFVYPVAVGIVAWLINNKHVKKWARKNRFLKKEFEEIEVAEQLQSSAYGKHAGEQSFDLEVYTSRWFLILGSGGMCGAVYLFGYEFYIRFISGLVRSSTPLPDFVAGLSLFLIFSFLAGLGLKKTFLTPTSFRITPKTFFIKCWWPGPSPDIDLNEVSQIQLRWGDASQFGGSGKIIHRIIFILRKGKKYTFHLSTFTPSSMKKLVQFLNQSVVSDKVVNLPPRAHSNR
jgi:hypothetical protein